MAKLILQSRSLVMVGGMPGSGKSHLLSRVRAEPHALKLSADDLRADVQAERGFSRDDYIEECIEEARDRFFIELHEGFSAGESILIEAAFLRAEARREMIDWCYARNYAAHLILVTTTWPQCLQGNEGRPREVPFTKMCDYWQAYETLLEQIRLGKLDNGLASALLLGRSESLEEIVFSR